MSQYAKPEAVVDTEWLEQHRDDSDLVLIDANFDLASYEAGHIPGAICWHAVGTLLQPNYQTNFDAGHVQSLLGAAGIGDDTTVVATSDHLGVPPWVYWYLKSVGHNDVRVLNGGNKKWQAEGRPFVDEVPAIDPITTPAAAPTLDLSRRADMGHVLAVVEGGDGVLLDVRAEEEFRGEIFLVAPPRENERAGHIPGAAYLYYEDALSEEGTFLPAESLRERYAAVGIAPDQNIITYCAVGMRASHSWFVLSELLGYPRVANYDLSWNEWGRNPDTPIASPATGESR